MEEGDELIVKLYGDDKLYFGVVSDRPRKLWVVLTDHPIAGFIADENNIEDWWPND